ncbi:hypothetical protein NR996_03165 [Lactobacillus rodentium]|uniref:Uncharacterized protein n=1 Tax=Lactobacillus rodentium TaxID=947835 RepID=A0A2Z6TSM5_9LACO|nr:hypothetical protein [Lactobacillus rodentium]MCR1894409.1 hypothetical protein [Lactobacillus rodentium]GBG04709.1 hypothetical protein LrDSM24759_06230 [Lactobacillus rodentium]
MTQIWPIFLGILIIPLIFIIFKEKGHFEFIKALVLFALMLIMSLLIFIALLYIAFLSMHIDKGLKLGNLFILVAIMIVIAGEFLYLGLRVWNKVFPFEVTILTIIEYYIQWTLIYFTVYQAVFANIDKVSHWVKYIKVGNILDPNLLAVIILPSFMSAWIGVVLFKKHIHAI